MPHPHALLIHSLLACFQAIESKSRSELEKKIKLALSVAVSDGARNRLEEELKQAENNNVSAAAPDRPVFTAASILSLRLDENEIGTRALPVLGVISKARLAGKVS
jgi:hypothetical protein